MKLFNDLKKSALLRTNIFIIIISSIVLIGFGIEDFFRIRFDMYTDIKKSSIDVSNRLEKTLAGPMWNILPDEMDKVIEAEMADKRIYAILVKKPDGVSTFTGRIRDKKWNIIPAKKVPDDNFIRNKSQIKMMNEELGYVEVYYTTVFLKKALIVSILIIISKTLLLDFILLISQLLLFRKIIIKPMKTLEEAAIKIGKKEFDINISVKSDDEFGTLAKTFNLMSQQLNISFSERESLLAKLSQSQVILEQQVKERTSDLKKTNEALEIAKEKADDANKAKSIFLANMSHELRSPMNAILGYSQLMQKNSAILSSLDLIEELQIINSSGEHLLALINDILDLSKIEAGHMQLTLQTFDIDKMFHDIEMMFRLCITEKGLWFNVEIIDTIPRYVIGDEQKLKQIIINLIGNAVKFTKEGGILITAICTPFDDSKRIALIIEVVDTGSGISEDEIGKLFGCFEQTESGKTSGGGSGLGLAISREYARLMGGDITMKSTRGQGSSVHLEVNIEIGASKDIETSIICREILGLEDNQSIPKILIVDDIAESRMLLVKLIKLLGIEAVQAVNGKEAVDIFKNWKPDFIWMDMRMPVMNGYEATKMIRTMEGGKEVKIVAVTASGLEEEKQLIIDISCDDYLRKPYKDKQIYNMLTKHLGLKYRYEEDSTVSIDAVISNEEIRQKIMSLSEEIRKDLIESVILLDTDKVSALIKNINDFDNVLGSVFEKMVKNFEYDKLLSLLEQ